ncbi:MAG: ribose-phosphate pyrophosphokinase [Candidatus Harrisonbacteria bacterium]|nr:ribose-phosphate pyrophosphokinase [Candidatus Harrisonbacteria bacterium]
MLPSDRFVVYGGTGHHELDAEVLQLINRLTQLRLRFNHSWHNIWPDGEPGFRLETPERIQGRHALIFSCPVTSKLEGELKDLVTACKQQYGATSVIVVLSFLRYRRQDRRELNHEITRLRWFIRDLKHWGADQLILVEPHSLNHTQAYCKEFGLELHVADPTRLFADKIAPLVQTLGGPDATRVYSPDLGSVGRALGLAQAIGARVIATPKKRVNTRVEMVTREDFMKDITEIFGADLPISCDVHDLRGLHLIMREDEIDSGATAVTTGRYLTQAGASSVHFIATHPVCSRGWKMRLFPFNDPQPFQTVWLGNTRPRGDGETEYEGGTDGKVTTVDIAPAIAETLIKVLEGVSD